jgi:hypothetical protein
MRLLFGFILLNALLAQQCDIDLGNINQFVVSYEVKVTNSSPTSLAAVTVQMKGGSRSSTLGKGKSVDLLTFTGGDYVVTVVHIALRRAQLQRRVDTLKTFVDTATDPADLATIQAQIKAYNDSIAVIDGGTSGATCKGTVKPGKIVTIVVSEQAGQWHC